MLSIALHWRLAVGTTVLLACVRVTTRTTTRPSSSDLTATTSRRYVTHRRSRQNPGAAFTNSSAAGKAQHLIQRDLPQLTDHLPQPVWLTPTLGLTTTPCARLPPCFEICQASFHFRIQAQGTIVGLHRFRGSKQSCCQYSRLGSLPRSVMPDLSLNRTVKPCRKRLCHAHRT